MDSLQTLLQQQQPQEPDEAKIIKHYIAEQFDEPAIILVQPQAIVITVRSASLANTLRLRTTDLQKISNTTKRLVFIIGQ